MRLMFLGTAAAEGIPSLFCKCECCKKSRIMKGKNIRKRSALLINDDLIIDMGPDLLYSAQQYNLSLNKLKYILVTHAHFDHFYPENLEIRSERYQKKNFPIIEILGNSSVFFKLSQMGYNDDELYIHRNELIMYKKYNFGKYIVIPIPANHAHEFGMAANYIIKFENRTILYATDTGKYKEKWIKQLKDVVFDAIILDGTNIFSETSENHLNIDGIIGMKNKLINNKNTHEKTKFICTHFSHGNLPLHDQLCEMSSRYNLIMAYDGMEIKL